jgi:hypothetical protein
MKFSWNESVERGKLNVRGMNRKHARPEDEEAAKAVFEAVYGKIIA